MAVRDQVNAPPAVFRRALESLRAATMRPEVVLRQTAAPARLAPHSLAMTADVVVDGAELATGRLVLLHDPAGQEAWQGTFRVVIFVRAELEPEMATDPLLPRVGWAWLRESLDEQGAAFIAPSATVTRVGSEHFGDLAGRAATTQIEIRASWTPVPADAAGAEASGPARAQAGQDVGAHLRAWCALLCTAAGLPPEADAVPITTRRGPRSRG